MRIFASLTSSPLKTPFHLSLFSLLSHQKKPKKHGPQDRLPGPGVQGAGRRRRPVQDGLPRGLQGSLFFLATTLVRSVIALCVFSDAEETLFSNLSLTLLACLSLLPTPFLHLGDPCMCISSLREMENFCAFQQRRKKGSIEGKKKKTRALISTPIAPKNSLSKASTFFFLL